MSAMLRRMKDVVGKRGKGSLRDAAAETEHTIVIADGNRTDGDQMMTVCIAAVPAVTVTARAGLAGFVCMSIVMIRRGCNCGFPGMSMRMPVQESHAHGAGIEDGRCQYVHQAKFHRAQITQADNRDQGKDILYIVKQRTPTAPSVSSLSIPELLSRVMIRTVHLCRSSPSSPHRTCR